MCGIVGYIAARDAAFPEARQHFLRHALIMDTLRGEDSTGIISVYEGADFDVNTARTVASGDKFVNTKHWEKIKRDGWATVGHNRAATLGSVKLANAHPFRVGDITLVHNGTLEEKGASLPTFDKDLEVDSMQIAVALNAVEPGQAGTVLSQIHGSFCVVWTDERDKTINMARNATRPMHFTFNQRRDFLMFMSDGHMLTSINRSLRYSQAQGGTIYSLDPHKHLKWKHGDLVPEVHPFDPFKPKPTPMTGPTPKKSGERGRSLSDATKAAQRHWEGYRRGGRNLRGDLPKGQVKSLKKLYEMNPLQNVRFEPSEFFNLSDTIQMVHGWAYLEHWGNTPWPAVIHRVTLNQAEAYGDRDWLVRPRGVTRPTIYSDSPSILCELIHCDWAGINHTNGTFSGKGKTHDKGPDGRLYPVKELDKKVEAGCANCHTNLSMHDMDRYALVNEGRDLICEDCKWESVA